jgi:hypothetical protein
VRVVLVTGTRDLRDPSVVHAELAKLAPDLVLHGWCPKGVDAYADAWAQERGVLVVRVAADWKRHGKRAAGPKRNSVLVRLAVAWRDLGHEVACLAMPGPNSVGTHDCGRKAHAAGLRIVRADVI